MFIIRTRHESIVQSWYSSNLFVLNKLILLFSKDAFKLIVIENMTVKTCCKKIYIFQINAVF